MPRKYIKASRYSGMSLSELSNLIEKLEELLELAEDMDVKYIPLQPNTYKIGVPYVGTYEGFLDINDAYYQLESPEDEDDWYDGHDDPDEY